MAYSMLRSTIAVFALALATAVSVSACDSEEGGDSNNEARNAEAAEHTDMVMSKLDADGNGTISANEAEGSPLQRHFAKADLDADGQVDKDEFGAFATQMADKHHGEGHGKAPCDGPCDGPCDHGGAHRAHGKMDAGTHADKVLGKLDANGDGAISREEAGKSRLAEHFGKVDANGDGTVTRDELAQANKHHGKRGHKGSPEEHTAKMLERHDVDSDGAISREEATGTRLEALFAKTDVDSDGQVTTEELNAMIEAKMQHHGKMKAHHGEGHHGVSH
jgi:Ca2+-binding EF-hand superfamily protein